MLRSVLILLALLVPGLAFLFDRPWLNVATIAIVVGGLGLLGWWLWRTYGTEEPDRPRPSPDPDAPDASLDELGIVDIQPQNAAASPAEETADEPDTTAAASPASSTEAEPSSSPATAPPPSAAPAEQADASPSAADTEAPPSPHEAAPVFGPLLESVRAALDAQTVCLLVQEEVALTYRIEAIASTHDAVRTSGTFDTQTPLLTAAMSRQSVTVRSLAEAKAAVEDLGYYTSPPAVDHLAAAPVSRPEESSSTFLLADAPADADLGTSRARTLLEHFAETIGLLLTTDRSVPDRPEATASTVPSNGQESPVSTAETSDETDEESPRPRREIIAEEMEGAQGADDQLALALVHLNRAESIARRGPEEVATAERLFKARLEQLVPNRRVERFGELTYGLFFRDGADTVEPQVAELESMMAQEEGELEGGVSVGVAVWNDEEPEALRTAATEALREAYETGTPTIVR